MTEEQRQINDYLDRKIDVTISHTDENGDWVYAVSPNEELGFWLNAFDTHDEALAYCKQHGLAHKDDE